MVALTRSFFLIFLSSGEFRFVATHILFKWSPLNFANSLTILAIWYPEIALEIFTLKFELSVKLRGSLFRLVHRNQFDID